MPAGIQVESVTLAVRDLARVTPFYRDVIGLAVVDSAPGRASFGIAGRAFLHLLQRPAAMADDTSQAGLYHTAVLLPSRADLGAWLAHARRSGVVLAGSADHLVSEAFYLADFEGNGVEVYADRPAALWRWAEGSEGRRIQMANRPIDAASLLRDAGSWAGAPEGTRIGHVHLRVGDLGAARAFYGAVLGMDVTAAMSGATFLSSGGYHHHVGVNTWHSAGAGPRDPGRAGLLAVTLAVDEATASGIVARSRVADLAGGLRDPWGIEVRITALAEETAP